MANFWTHPVQCLRNIWMVPWRNIRISDKAHLSLDWDFFWMFNLSTTDLTIMSCPFWIICSFHALHWHDTEYDQVTNCDWMWHVRQWQWHRVTIFLDLPNAGLLIESYHNYKSFQHDLGLWWRHKHLWNISHLELERPETELLLLFPVDIFHNFFPPSPMLSSLFRCQESTRSRWWCEISWAGFVYCAKRKFGKELAAQERAAAATAAAAASA